MMDTKITAIAPFVRGPAAGSTLNVLGVTHIYKATAARHGRLLLALGGRVSAGRRVHRRTPTTARTRPSMS